jgi:hypothetical protein
MYYSSVTLIKKLCQPGKDRHPRYRDQKKGLLTYTEKTLETISPPYTGASASHVRLVHCYLQLGWVLASALRMRRGERIFLTRD